MNRTYNFPNHGAKETDKEQDAKRPSKQNNCHPVIRHFNEEAKLDKTFWMSLVRTGLEGSGEEGEGEGGVCGFRQ